VCGINGGSGTIAGDGTTISIHKKLLSPCMCMYFFVCMAVEKIPPKCMEMNTLKVYNRKVLVLRNKKCIFASIPLSQNQCNIY
jgi:hypothetical protein